MPPLFWKYLAPLLLLSGFHAGAAAQDAAAKLATKLASTSELALYQGADRQQRLIEAAKKEGTLTVYHVYPNLPVVIAEFTKKYGIKVKTWRAGSEAVLQRLTAEARSGRSEVDVVQNNAPENEAAHREKLLQEVRSIHHKDLIAAALPSHGEWVGITQDIWSLAYNTNAVKKEELPKSYADLQDSKWKGRLGIESNNHVWFGTLLGELGEEQGSKIFNTIMTTNGISARKGHSLLTVLVASGEVPLALTVYSWNPEQIKQKNAPIEGLLLSPVIAQISGIAMLKRAPNPASALLFYEFMISEGQKHLADTLFVPVSKKFVPPYGSKPVKFIDPSKALDMQDKWQKNFDEMIVKRAK